MLHAQPNSGHTETLYTWEKCMCIHILMCVACCSKVNCNGCVDKSCIHALYFTYVCTYDMTVYHLHAGPFNKHPEPVLKSDGAVIGPGACCIVRGPNDTEWMLYHSWNQDRTYRAMSIAELTWHEDKPVVHASWGKPQHAPFL